MKKIILILSIMIINISCKAQNNTINSTELTMNGINYLGNNVSLVTQYLGQPNTIENYYFEMNDEMSQKYHYNGVLFYILNNKVNSFEITTSNYSFSKYNIKIGDNIESLQTIFPLSFSNRTNNGLTIPLSDIDKFVIISYNNNLIVKIAIYDY